MLAIARQRMLGQSFKKILPAVSVLRSYSSAAKQIAFQYTVVVPPEELSSLGLVYPSRT